MGPESDRKAQRGEEGHEGGDEDAHGNAARFVVIEVRVAPRFADDSEDDVSEGLDDGPEPLRGPDQRNGNDNCKGRPQWTGVTFWKL